MQAGTAALLATLVVLAGCTSVPFFGGSEEPVPTVTPVSPDDLPTQHPPGVTSLRVIDSTALGRAHARAIENTSYVVATNRTVRYVNGTLVSHLATRVSVDRDRRFLASASTAGPAAPVFIGAPPAEATYWSNGTTYLRRLTHDGETTYAEFDPPDTWVGTWRYWAEVVPFGARNNRPATYYAAVFSSVPVRVVDRVPRNGTTVFRLEEHVGWTVSGEGFPGRTESIEDVTLVALVDGDGLVRSLELAYTGTLDGERVHVTRTIRYTGIGSTEVDRPSWSDRAIADGVETGADPSDAESPVQTTAKVTYSLP